MMVGIWSKVKGNASDGTTHLLLSPLELIEKLAALVPPPRLNLVRYHGVLGPNAAGRKQIVPGCYAEGDEDGADTTCSHGDPAPTPKPSKPSYRLSWARLLARVFRIDVTACPHCGGKMKIIAALAEPASIGLFGLASHAAEIRRKEIGVRKALGATIPGLIGLVSREFVVLVAVSGIVAIPFAYTVMRGWLDEFAYRMELGPGVFVLGVLLTIVIAQLTVMGHALKAARTDPAVVLRKE